MSNSLAGHLGTGFSAEQLSNAASPTTATVRALPSFILCEVIVTVTVGVKLTLTVTVTVTATATATVTVIDEDFFIV